MPGDIRAPLLLIPGIQGRWEYMRPTVDALAARYRVLTFALCGERASGLKFVPARGLDNYVSQAKGVLDAQGVDRAIVCGVSFGGLAAVRFAARHPERTIALVLVSTPGPRPTIERRHRLYARAPYLFGPLFLLESPRRLWPEFAVTFPRARARWRFALSQGRTLLSAPLSLRRMGARARIMPALDLTGECARITAPTLIVTGEPGLDRVVPVEGTSAYARLIRGARSAVIERTGHLGAVTRPEAFAALIADFLSLIARGAPPPPAEGLNPDLAGPHPRSPEAAGAALEGRLSTLDDARVDPELAERSRSDDGCGPHAA